MGSDKGSSSYGAGVNMAEGFMSLLGLVLHGFCERRTFFQCRAFRFITLGISQYPLIKEYSLNRNMKPLIISGILLN